jgi:hypothetical protein
LSAVLISRNHSITHLISFTKNGSNQRSILSVYGPWNIPYLSAARAGNATRQNIPAWPRSTAGFYGRDKKKTEKQQKFPTVITTAATTETLPANA